MNASGSFLVAIAGGVTSPPERLYTMIVKFFASVPAVFFAVSVMVYVPALEGVPERMPASDNVRPGGIEPVQLHVIGALPDAVNSVRYSVPVVATGISEVVMTGAVSLSEIMSVNVRESFPPEFDALTVKL